VVHDLTLSGLRRLVLIGLLAVAGCGGPVVSSTPGPSAGASPALTAAPTTLTSAAPSGLDAAGIEALVGEMAAAVNARDRDGYLRHVDLADPVFALEHTRWVADWAELHPVLSYGLDVDGITGDGATATAQVTATWAVDGFEAPRTATWAARFTGGPDGWRYAGEVWRASAAEHFQLLVAPGVGDAEAAILPALPDVYELVTSTLAYAPAGSMEIKVYADPESLVANTLLSLPPIRGWNEPGEALKLFFDDDPSIPSVIAHEFTHFVLFDRAGTQRTRMPWWLDEGTASFVARSIEQESAGGDTRLRQVAEWAAAGELAPWADMAVFEETPVDLWRFVYPQGYAMVTYVTETYGEAKRNAWLAAMATEMAIDAATPAVLGLPFDDLDAGFRAWAVAAA